jgi:hypothetical protein
MCQKLILVAIAFVALAGRSLAQPKDLLSRAKFTLGCKVSKENLRRIVLGMLNYETGNSGFPTDILDNNGKPLLSWRVAILPYIDNNLFEQFHLDEAWDSDNNKKLLELMPKIFEPVRVKADKGKTFYQCFSGNGALISSKPTKIASITDGTADTFAVVEAGEAVEWTKPVDIAFDPKKPLPKLGGMFDGNFHAAFCDGSVCYIRKNIKQEVLKKYVTIAGSERSEDNELGPGK